MREVKKLEPYRTCSPRPSRGSTPRRRAARGAWPSSGMDRRAPRSRERSAVSPPGASPSSGSLDPEVLPTAYLGADLFAFPGRFHVVYLQAAAAGLPVVACAGPEPDPMVAPGGALLTAATPDAFGGRSRPAPRRPRPPADDGRRRPALRHRRPHARDVSAPPGRGALPPGHLVRSIYIALIRHAPTAWNAEGRVLGQADPPSRPRAPGAPRTGACPPDLRALAAEGQLGWATSPLQPGGRDRASPRRDSPRRGAAARRAGLGRVDGPGAHGRGAPGRPARSGTAAPPGGESPARVLARVRAWLDELAPGQRAGDLGGRDPQGRDPRRRRGGAPVGSRGASAGAPPARAAPPRAPPGGRAPPAGRPERAAQPREPRPDPLLLPASPRARPPRARGPAHARAPTRRRARRVRPGRPARAGTRPGRCRGRAAPAPSGGERGGERASRARTAARRSRATWPTAGIGCSAACGRTTRA